MDKISIDPKSSVPIWVQLRSRLLYLITSGNIAVGEQLPTLHNLAIQLSINYNTVYKVYQTLERDGLIESRRGYGTVVISNTLEGRGDPIASAELITDEYLEKLAELGLDANDALDFLKRRAEADK